MAVYGKDDLRGLDKSKLWCSVQSRQGSLDLVFCLAVLGMGIGTAMIKDMSATQKTILGLGVFAVFAGYIGADIYKTYSAESIEVEKQETERQKNRGRYGEQASRAGYNSHRHDTFEQTSF